MGGNEREKRRGSSKENDRRHRDNLSEVWLWLNSDVFLGNGFPGCVSRN